MDDILCDALPKDFEIAAFGPGVVSVPQELRCWHARDEGEKLFEVRQRVVCFDHEVDIQTA
ncbi:hypothetical protein D3C77_766980 [compost metagenome]